MSVILPRNGIASCQRNRIQYPFATTTFRQISKNVGLAKVSTLFINNILASTAFKLFVSILLQLLKLLVFPFLRGCVNVNNIWFWFCM